MDLSCTIFDIFDFEKYCDFEIRVRGTQNHRNVYHSIACLWFPISVYCAIVTLSLKCTFLRYSS